MSQISSRLNGLVQSDIRRMSRECERVEGINLGQGICDLPTIPELVEGATEAIQGSKATYSRFEGIDLLRRRIARKRLDHARGGRLVDLAVHQRRNSVVHKPYHLLSLLVPNSGLSCSAIASRARKILDRTVPIGQSMACAISS